MISRVMSKRLPMRATGVLGSRPRWFSSAPALDLSSVEAPAVPAKKEEEKGVIAEYGLWPFVGFASVIAISKEFVLINEELLLGGMLLNAFFGLYVMVRDPFTESIDEGQASYHKIWYDYYDKNIEGTKNAMDQSETFFALGKHVRDMYAYQADLQENVLHARSAKKHAERSKMTLEKLNRTLAFEQNLAAKEKEVIDRAAQVTARERVNKYFSSGKNVDASVANAISSLTKNDGKYQSELEGLVSRERKLALTEIRTIEDIPAETKTILAQDIDDYKRNQQFLKAYVEKILKE